MLVSQKVYPVLSDDTFSTWIHNITSHGNSSNKLADYSTYNAIDVYILDEQGAFVEIDSTSLHILDSLATLYGPMSTHHRKVVRFVFQSDATEGIPFSTDSDQYLSSTSDDHADPDFTPVNYVSYSAISAPTTPVSTTSPSITTTDTSHVKRKRCVTKPYANPAPSKTLNIGPAPSSTISLGRRLSVPTDRFAVTPKPVRQKKTADKSKARTTKRSYTNGSYRHTDDNTSDITRTNIDIDITDGIETDALERHSEPSLGSKYPFLNAVYKGDLHEVCTILDYSNPDAIDQTDGVNNSSSFNKSAVLTKV
jgi:hypothetical protein